MIPLKRGVVCTAALSCLLMAGCVPAQNILVEKTAVPAADVQVQGEKDTSKVASANEMVEPADIVEEGMVPVYASSLKDGAYSITVDSSSSMFNVEACTLTVKDGTMSATMTMGGTGYRWVYMGTGEEAAAASEDDYIAYVEGKDGTHTFTVPVEALDKGIDCAAFSKKKEKWYDRTILFRADSLDQDAFADGSLVTVESLGLADGTYSVEVALQGGSGRAHIESPATFVVESGAATATVVWGSSNYDYMRIGDEKYLPVNKDGNSTFELPVSAFDHALAVSADTTAMSTPHEIDYTLTFDSASIEKA